MPSWKDYPVQGGRDSHTLVILDNAHSTAQDRTNKSPNFAYSSFKDEIPGVTESFQNRLLVKEIIRLQPYHDQVHLVELYPETHFSSPHATGDRAKTGIPERIYRIREIIRKYGQTNYIYLVSMHTNYSTHGTWDN